jgi:hypothetical protein
MIARLFCPALAVLMFSFAGACTKPEPQALAVGKPVFSFDYESVRELLISRNEPTGQTWTATFGQDGWLGPQQVTPRWLVKQAPEGLVLSDSLADGGFLRHLLDSLKGLRKVNTTPNGDDASFGLAPAWTRLEWSEGARRFEILLGSPVATGGRYARIGNERLVVNGAALDMLDMVKAFQRARLQKLFTWSLDDADRITVRWSKPQSSWSVERSTGGWATAGTSGKRLLVNAADQALEALSHLQIETFDLSPSSFAKPELTIEWLDRADHRLTIEIDGQLRARSSDRPDAVFQLFHGAREVLARSRYTR